MRPQDTKGRSVTVKDVAQYAGVSIASVSRVLNNSETVHEEIRERVQNAIKALNYHPNRLGRNLRVQSTSVIALVVPDILNSFFISVAGSAEEVAFENGCTLVICNTGDDPAREQDRLQVLSNEASAGIILCTANERTGHTKVRQLIDRGIAVVALDRRVENAPVDSVLSDNFGGSRTAVSHLIELGHRRIGIIAGPDRFAPGRERRLGYEQAFSDYDLPIDRTLIKVTDFHTLSAKQATEELLCLPEPPTALLVTSGRSALGSLHTINEKGWRIPDDISVIVFDDLEWAEAYNPPLTTIAQNTRELGKMAAELLFQRMGGAHGLPQERRLPTELRIRHSCKRI